MCELSRNRGNKYSAEARTRLEKQTRSAEGRRPATRSNGITEACVSMRSIGNIDLMGGTKERSEM